MGVLSLSLWDLALWDVVDGTRAHQLGVEWPSGDQYQDQSHQPCVAP